MADSTAPVELTWDIAGDARRPSLEDVGGANLVNDEDEGGLYVPPTDGSEVEATWLNQVQKQVAAVAGCAFSAKMTVDFSAGTPGIVALMTPGGDVVPGSFTLTDSAAGNTLIAWTAGVLPAMICDPDATVNADSDTTISAIPVSATSIRVKTRTAGVLADARFTVTIN